MQCAVKQLGCLLKKLLKKPLMENLIFCAMYNYKKI